MYWWVCTGVLPCKLTPSFGPAHSSGMRVTTTNLNTSIRGRKVMKLTAFNDKLQRESARDLYSIVAS